MIEFIGTSLQLESIITAHTLNSFCTSVWRISVKNLGLIWMSPIQVESYVTTDGQSASLSWNKSLIWVLRSDFITLRQIRVCWCWTLFLTRGRVCRLHAVILGSESRGTRDHILLSQIRNFHFRRLLRLAGSRWRYSSRPPRGILSSSSRVESCITTDGQLTSLSWNKAPIWGLRPDFYYVRQLRVC
jgi:hypothetical protein